MKALEAIREARKTIKIAQENVLPSGAAKKSDYTYGSDPYVDAWLNDLATTQNKTRGTKYTGKDMAKNWTYVDIAKGRAKKYKNSPYYSYTADGKLIKHDKATVEKRKKQMGWGNKNKKNPKEQSQPKQKQKRNQLKRQLEKIKGIETQVANSAKKTMSQIQKQLQKGVGQNTANAAVVMKAIQSFFNGIDPAVSKQLQGSSALGNLKMILSGKTDPGSWQQAANKFLNFAMRFGAEYANKKERQIYQGFSGHQTGIGYDFGDSRSDWGSLGVGLTNLRDQKPSAQVSWKKEF